LISRVDIEQRERQTLAPFAAFSAETRGRGFPQHDHPLRTVYQRDRDRIVHSTAFRRMEYKTQVFLAHEGDHFRTRLTHTIEVAQISRTLARNLRLNEDLTEAVALVHDVGHTPFGHSGEDVLDELLTDRDGFNHNRQSLRVVDILEQRYPEHPGLNLSYEVREGIVKHETTRAITHPDFDSGEWPTLEASLVDIADEVAYNAHDIDDGLRSGLIRLDDIRDLAIWGEQRDELFGHEEGTSGGENDQTRYRLVRWLVDRKARDVLDETQRRIDALGVVDMKTLRSAPSRVCAYSEAMAASVDGLKAFLRSRLYCHPQLMAKSERARQVVVTLFNSFKADPTLMPARFQEMLLTEQAETVIADYIAGMTDRYAERLYGDVN